MTLLTCGDQIRLSKEQENVLRALAEKAGNAVGDIKTWPDLWEAMLATYSGDALLELAAQLGVSESELDAPFEDPQDS